MNTLRFVSIVLAAGEGRRAGGFKPLFSFDKELRFVDHIIRSAAPICAEIRVVGGAYYDQLECHLARFHPTVSLLRNTEWKRGGMFSSVQKGLVGTDLPCFIHPADIPGPGADVYRALADKWKICKADVLRPTFNKIPGHPILVSEATASHIVNASPGRILRDVLREKHRLDIPVSDLTILKDYDTELDLRELRGPE